MAPGTIYPLSFFLHFGNPQDIKVFVGIFDSTSTLGTPPTAWLIQPLRPNVRPQEGKGHVATFDPPSTSGTLKTARAYVANVSTCRDPRW